MSEDLSTCIDTTERRKVVFVGECNDGLWLSLHVAYDRAHCALSREQAQQLLEAIQKILAKVPA